MGSHSSKWAFAAFGLMLVVGFLPALASGQTCAMDVKTGTATNVGAPDPHPPGGAGRGQVNIVANVTLDPPLGTLKGCSLAINKILYDGAEFVHAEPCIVPDDDPTQPDMRLRSASDRSALFESNQKVRPTCRMQCDKKNGFIECRLKVDRAEIDASASPVTFETAFDLTCDGQVYSCADDANWQRGPHPDSFFNFRVCPLSGCRP